MKIQSNIFGLLITFLSSATVFAEAYVPGRATKSTLGGDNSCVIGSSGGTTGACYIYYQRDWNSSDMPSEWSELPSKAPVKPFVCDESTPQVCSFYLQYADDVVDILDPDIDDLRKCTPVGDPEIAGAYKINKPSSGATGADAAMYTMLYGAMMSDRSVAVTVNDECEVTAVRLVETVARDFK